MLADQTDPDEITRIEYTYDGCLVDEIDLPHLDLDDNEYWLHTPLQCSTESSIKDLYAWLKMDPELDVQNNKKYIDTRTFTRPKKRSSRISFESVFLGLPPYAKNILRLKNTDTIHMDDLGKYASIGDKESVPPMLKPSAKTPMSILSDETLIKSGQESMEAFLNMSQSKGIDSFINLGEPDFSDALMNISQPSLLYTSVALPMKGATFSNNTITITNKNTMAQQALHDDIISPNETYCVSSLNNTFSRKSAQLGEDSDKIYNTVTLGKASVPPSNFDGEETDTATLSSTFVTEPNANINIAQLPNIANSNVKTLDTTYLSSAKDDVGRQGTVSLVSYEPAIRANLELNTTCNISSNGTESVAFLETQADDALDMSFMVPIYSQSTPIQPMLNSTSKFAAKYLDQTRQISYSAQKAPTSLRRELLAEIRRSSEHKLDTTYNHAPGDHPDLADIQENVQVICDKDIRSEVDVLPENRYHTYKKSTLAVMSNECKNQFSERGMVAMPVQKESAMNHKFYTFTKKSNNVEKLGENTETTTVKNVEVKRPDMDGTFCKPFPNIPKRNAPRILSKLPQFLRKSNPNLVSNSLKTASSIPGNQNVFSAGFIKGSQPNIAQNVEKPVQCKLYPFSKLKSGSEQRLVEVNVNNTNEFSTKGATGSTESIESTQSAHSAPDLDDRLIMCSENSHNPCNRRTMNIEQLHQLVRMQEESLKQDLPPHLNRGVLENTWVEEKTNLPSPILKNGIEHGVIDANSPLNTDPSMKCSSPVISPTESSHASNEGNLEDNVVKSKDEVAMIGKTEDPNQIVPKAENKTRLRQPTNWATGSKLSTVTSGIPRPASRIPALRFARPSTKIIQNDLRKGCT